MLEPLAAGRKAREEIRGAKAAAINVEFFTMVLGRTDPLAASEHGLCQRIKRSACGPGPSFLRSDECDSMARPDRRDNRRHPARKDLGCRWQSAADLARSENGERSLAKQCDALPAGSEFFLTCGARVAALPLPAKSVRRSERCTLQ